MPGPPATVLAPAALPPRDVTRLIGREREVAEARRLLLRDDVRLVTLTGAPGVGKTRVARRVAHALRDLFTGGVCPVDLESVRDPVRVLAAIAAALDARERAGQSLLDVVAHQLAGRPGPVLLVVDNFEQVLPAGPHLASLLAAVPNAKALVTSRAALSVYGEWDLVVPPLDLPLHPPADKPHPPAAESVGRSHAVQLFVERAQAKRPDFTLTAENAATVAAICRRLDGIPLAIELAAALTRLMPPEALLRRVERSLTLLTGGPGDQAARHQTMRDAVAWSHDLLDGHERRLFRWLGVFAGGCTLEAIEGVDGAVAGDAAGGDAIERSDVLGTVAALVDKHLLQREDGGDAPAAEPRFRMFEVIREFATLQLQVSGEDPAARDRHAAYFLALAERADADSLTTPQRATARLGELEREHANLHEALRWLAHRPETGKALRLAAALGWYWSVRGHLSEGRQQLAALLASSPSAPAPLRAQALDRAAALAAAQGDDPGATALYRESLALWRGLGHRAGEAGALLGLGNAALERHDLEAALGYYNEGLEASRAAGDLRKAAALLERLGSASRSQGDREAARTLLGESLAIRRGIGDQRGIAWSLESLGWIAREERDLETARARYEECLAIRRELHDQRGIANALSGLGWVAGERGEYEAARTLLEESIALKRALGDRRGIMWSLASLANVHVKVGERAAARAALEERLALARDLGDTRGLAATLATLARLLRAAGETAAAQALLDERKTLPQTPAADAPATDASLPPPFPQTSPPELTPAPAESAGHGPGLAFQHRASYPAGLTEREVELLRLVAAHPGWSNQDLARALVVEAGTIRSHLGHIYSKLDAHSRYEAIVKAREAGLPL